MNILQLIPQLTFGGAEGMVAQLSGHLAIAGNTVHIVTPGLVAREIADPLVAAGVHIHRLEAHRNPVRQIIALLSLLKRHSISLVHVHLFPAVYIGAFAKSFAGSNIRFVFTEHSDSNRRRHIPALRWIERWIYRQYVHVVAVSEGAAATLEQWAGRTDISVIANGVEFERFQRATPLDRTTFHFTPDDVLLLCVGGLRVEKNQRALVCLLPQLPHRYKLVLVGDGPCRRDIERTVLEQGCESRVVLAGASANPEGFMKMCDVYVSASLFEGFGLGPVEALASGMPVVVSDIPGHREVLGDHATYCDHRNAAEFAAAVEIEASARSGGSLRAPVVLEQYSAQHFVARHEALYQQVMDW